MIGNTRPGCSRKPLKVSHASGSSRKRHQIDGTSESGEPTIFRLSVTKSRHWLDNAYGGLDARCSLYLGWFAVSVADSVRKRKTSSALSSSSLSRRLERSREAMTGSRNRGSLDSRVTAAK